MILPKGAESTLTENAASPFLAEPAQLVDQGKILQNKIDKISAYGPPMLHGYGMVAIPGMPPGVGR
jgi:hypothetical protein